MINIFKKTKIAYFISAFTGVALIFFIFESLVPQLVLGLFSFVWIFIIALFFNGIAFRHLAKMLSSANAHCQVEQSLNNLYGIYRANTNKKSDLIVAIYICNLLSHFGKYEMALKMILEYNPDALLKGKKEVIFKCYYYDILVTCYSCLEQKEKAIEALKKVKECLDNKHFNPKLKDKYEIHYKTMYYTVIDGEKKPEEILPLLEKMNDGNILLSKVSAEYATVSWLKKFKMDDEIQPHIDFIKENGGDTFYAKCANNNDFSSDFIKQINDEKWEPTPKKYKNNKELIISIIAAVVVVAIIIICR